MITQLYKKLDSITALSPVKDNEVLIRNLAHRLLNEINQNEFSGLLISDKEVIRQRCLNCIRLLNIDIIMNSSAKDYVYETYNLTRLVSDTLTACGLLLCKTEVKLVFNYCTDVYIEFPLKLILPAIVGMVRIFCKPCTETEIFFSLKKGKRYTVLSAESVNINPDTVFNTNETLSLLRKTGELTNGAFLTAVKGSSVICALSMENRKGNMKNIKYSPDYIELLSDKMSEIHIGLS